MLIAKLNIAAGLVLLPRPASASRASMSGPALAGFLRPLGTCAALVCRLPITSVLAAGASMVAAMGGFAMASWRMAAPS